MSMLMSLTEKKQWYKDLLQAQADEKHEKLPQYKDFWSGTNWEPVIAKNDVNLRGRFVVLKGEVVLMDKNSVKVLTKDDTCKKMMIGKSFATYYLPRNMGGTNTSLEVLNFKEMEG